MSEYQYYEFQAVDRRLTEKEMAELRACSTRARITPTRFVNDYSWGSFKGNEDAWMEKYFDAFLYLANWGTHVLKLRLPARLLDLNTARLYAAGEHASAREKNGMSRWNDWGWYKPAPKRTPPTRGIKMKKVGSTWSGREDEGTDPVLLAEVLSDATRNYDRGDKFALYKSIPTLREYLLVEQKGTSVEQRGRGERGTWSSRTCESLHDVVKLSSVPVEVPMAGVYQRVFGSE